MRPRILIPVLLLALCAAVDAAQCRAVIVVGDPGDAPAWAANFARWGEAWRELLIARGADAGEVRLLDTPAKDRRGAVAPETLATRTNVIAALDAFARACAPEDQAVVVLIGHGYQCEGIGKLCLAGPDLTDAETAKALAPLRAGHAAIFVLAPEGMLWAKSLARSGRAIVCANVKQSAPYFGEFLLRELGAGGNLLDAFNRASLATVAWYQNQFQEKSARLATVHGRANQDVFRAVYPDVEFEAGDAEPRAPINDMHRLKDFIGRRVLVELAGLEDDGDGSPTNVFGDSADPSPIPGTGDGRLAKDLVLGTP
jgi:hypothetical protein